MKTTKSWDSIPKLKFNSSPAKQAIQYIRTGTSVYQKHYYSRNSFIVLPYLKRSPNTIHFPRPPKELQSAIFQLNYENVSSIRSKRLINQVCKLMKFKEVVADYSEAISLFPQFWQTLHKFLPKEYLKVNTIEICTSRIGTVGSVTNWWQKKSKSIVLVRRIDTDPTYIFQLIILDRLVKFQTELGLTNWNARIAVLDYICTQTEIKQFINKPISMLKGLEKSVGSSLQLESSKYLEELGCGKSVKIEIQNNYVSIENTILMLTKNELEVMKILINNRGTVVDYDLLANTIWKDNSAEKFSLEAMNKIIERIRRKLAMLGYPKTIIKTVRNLGYVLE